MNEKLKTELAAAVLDMLDEKRDSISISRTSKGAYSFDVKIYSPDLMSFENRKGVIDNLKAIDTELRETFKDEKGKD